MLTDLIYKIYDSIKSDFDNKKWVKFFLKMLTILILIFCMSAVIALLVLVIAANIEKIVITIGAIVCFFSILFSLLPKRKITPVQPDNSILEYDPITLESTYKMLRKNLCSVIGDVAEIAKLRKPATLSQMDAPTHFTIVSKCAIYHFLVLKLAEEIDTFTITGILQNAIEQRLSNNEIEGITQTGFFYNGQSYPSIMVDKVQDFGNCIRIDLAIVSDYYCKYRERRIYNDMDSSDPNGPHDKFF